MAAPCAYFASAGETMRISSSVSIRVPSFAWAGEVATRASGKRHGEDSDRLCFAPAVTSPDRSIIRWMFRALAAGRSLCSGSHTVFAWLA
jgi:hypothetical protein